MIAVICGTFTISPLENQGQAVRFSIVSDNPFRKLEQRAVESVTKPLRPQWIQVETSGPQPVLSQIRRHVYIAPSRGCRTLILTAVLSLAAILPKTSAWTAENMVSTEVPQSAAPKPSTGVVDPRLAPFDVLLSSFLNETNIPGAVLAVARNGKLVYARGFGYADRADQSTVHNCVQPDSLFRLASLSKPITAVAVLQLIERGKLRLEERVFERLAVAPLLEPGKTADPRLQEITVLQLLQHTAGWDSAKSFDPMFRSVPFALAFDANPPATPKQIIRYMAGQPLDFAPGERYAYSNFGYCLLGRLIESASGQPYATYVEEQVLHPLRARQTRLGKTLPAGRAPGEVVYSTPDDKTGPSVFGPDHGRLVPLPYGAWCLESMDSHGGWIGSAVDMVRFASAFDRPDACPVLNVTSIATMLACPEGFAGHEPDGNRKPTWYGCGWQVRPAGESGKVNFWHTGSLDGTACLLVHRHDGLSWAVLFNSRRKPADEHPGRAIDPLLHKAADAVVDWPDVDLFPKFP